MSRAEKLFTSDRQRPDIVIYPNRGPILLFSALTASATLIPIVAMVALFRPIFTGEVAFSAGDIPFMIVIVVFLLVFIAGFGYTSWNIASLLSPPAKPVLMITGEGISVGKMPPYSGFFIPWAEIALIASASFETPRYKYLCIFPKHPDQFLAQIPFLERFGRRLDARLYGVSLRYPQAYMQSSVATVLSQIATHYQSELSTHDVQLER